MLKRIITIVLTAVMVAGSIPATVFAAEEQPEELLTSPIVEEGGMEEAELHQAVPMTESQPIYFESVPINALNTEYSAEITPPDISQMYFTFVPSQTEYYVFSSTCEEDTLGFLYDEDMKLLASDDDSADGRNFSVGYAMEAGKMYYLCTEFYNAGTKGTVSVKAVLAHEYVGTVTKKATCTERGTERFTCKHCGRSYTDTIPYGHTYSNSVCTKCGAEENYKMTSVTAKKSSSGAKGTASSNNNDQTYYSYSASTVKSALVWENNNYVRAEYVDSGIVVEKYNADYKLISKKKIALELPIFGGIYMCDDYNFVVTGQTNHEENDNKEVIRVTRYSKDWVKEASASLYGANTTIPFDAGSLRFTRSDDMLYIRTCHEMYTSSDGKNHQANLTMSVKISDMTVTDEYSRVMNNRYGYVSHSFNQFIQADGSALLAVDHGDAYPRSVIMMKYDNPAGKTTFTGHTSYVNVLPIAENTTHYNYTGVSVGGFEYSDTHYLVAGNTTSQNGGIDQRSAQRNIFVTATPKNNFTEDATQRYYLTNYGKDANVKISNPHLVKIDDQHFCVLWSANETVYYCMLNNEGKKTSKVFSKTGQLSDCAPIVANGKIVWYVTNGTAPVFYQIETGIDTASEPLGHVYAYAYDNTYVCQKCGESFTLGEEHILADGVKRIYGENRYLTALNVAENLKNEMDISKFHTVIVASGSNFADALAGSYLAINKNAPILLNTNSGALANLAYIRENLQANGIVYILGGNAAVPAYVEEDLKNEGFTVKRLAGDDRYGTNLEILKEAGVDSQEILVCTGHNFADSLSASATGLPILMVNNKKGVLTEEQKTFLSGMSGKTFTIIGGVNAVSETMETAVRTYGAVERVFGSNRSETSVKVAERYFKDNKQIAAAYSLNFPDGLCGGPLAHLMGAPLILTNAGKEVTAADYVLNHGITGGFILGGPAVVSDDTARQVFRK